MKTITIKQPWASLIVEGIKDVENRTWPTKFRGRVLVHAGLKIDQSYFTEKIWDIPTDIQQKGKEAILKGMPTGAIIGSVDIVDCTVNHPSVWAEKSEMTIGALSMRVKPVYNWVLANPIKFPEPIPAKGKLSFWDYPNILAEPEEKGGMLYCHCQLPIDEKVQVANYGRGDFRCCYCGARWYK